MQLSKVYRRLPVVVFLCALVAPSLGGATVVHASGTPGPSLATGPVSASGPGLEETAADSGLRIEVLQQALVAYRRAADAGEAKRPLLTVIDYSLPSHERRLWVLDLEHGAVLAHELVAHGRGSGNDVATRFSNRPNSYQSSLGTFVTAGRYRGAHGLSLRLRGLDRGLNDNAMTRAIVVHGAWYVSDTIIRQQGRLGRSEGCPALSPDVAPRIIDLIAGGSVVFAYYPSPALEHTLAAR